MAYKRLFVFVEGTDDERFVSDIIIPIIFDRYDHIRIVLYAEEKKIKINNYIKSINSMGGYYFFLRDFDNTTCVTKRRNDTLQKYRRLTLGKIMIVINEIESWYLAGVSNSFSSSYKISIPRDTSDITKESFNAIMPSTFSSRIDFMIELLKNYTVSRAIKRNNSFKYFIGKKLVFN